MSYGEFLLRGDHVFVSPLLGKPVVAVCYMAGAQRSRKEEAARVAAGRRAHPHIWVLMVETPLNQMRGRVRERTHLCGGSLLRLLTRAGCPPEIATQITLLLPEGGNL